MKAKTPYYEVEFSNAKRSDTLIKIVEGKDNLTDEIMYLTSDNKYFIICVTEFTL